MGTTDIQFRTGTLLSGSPFVGGALAPQAGAAPMTATAPAMGTGLPTGCAAAADRTRTTDPQLVAAGVDAVAPPPRGAPV